ncbi:2-oxo-4-hydroxy-4-carboxy-5-ureidoimidazoline decarboxylase [Reyranella sp.]|jgi:2-oxo-4-hydroxy-4-carboxy-5-ureidoimidazoline decarboxylase|uniref:2-oxo-4-hydroxy-4-carboxy-5-ureidoimidazoline decarboxylase n=1 Tax=Reyranella sp. TaxID=1929291 RepID=UPI000BCAA173|nr:2-oxo-4-hydroxy-4-carboxy-5-ureidoimidazoline decarboxylase [Reyranella sp.]OYY42609.1 MAG: OHCU decarboxylase [Rhodospirillales bacterium 35-66-84]OYZ94445.1 MAG: OHCU decarboxylase [Rhodospirillales bacterium 24-66-33]OZB25367.1 MAG: OHCU decarboxylase [Rhodospirillales bacterium 39-66-50]HQS16442.1 2-oxo-4-hydroxy-4-carboxy-5-ureidoimidazoline decarboxylase [Reyranella sp.]HQT13458.1 2-oxo-4-hydroxy-4-carboxy-5-ureidoimidazoline decarboxylase [Reyranella sp.]
MIHSLDNLNRVTAGDFAAAVGDTFELAPWVAEAAAARRPFATVTALHDAMMGAVRAAPRERQLAFVCGHPDLAGKAARAGVLTEDSQHEQASVGLDALSEEEFARFHRLNDAYKAKFGFPFIVCVRRHTRDSILAQFERRLRHDAATEFATALQEIFFITRLRLAAKVTGEGMPRVNGRLSTHVLDTHAGRPAVGIAIELYEFAGERAHRIATATTNADGRTDAPLIGGRPLPIGRYELRFAVGDHFRSRGIEQGDPPFLDIVPLRFSIAEPEGHYHVPLLCTPWSYSTYRGS